ncbi:TPA: hypothetical protein QDA99_006600 [Burkholderia vietnamiensis]|uniref:hypothetical protein n=1 Tax=Burkholderia vietnamiensis TaxID=60552 RepID=UPI001589579A|nr:hypothetical protein [Burkholderia vietnamiensis]HDR9003037.1 hypothetical protein [Burkholderia vietnamiensis]HDR9006919.1 hypothetical protein [Burkholderia vietnamiensis]
MTTTDKRRADALIEAAKACDDMADANERLGPAAGRGSYVQKIGTDSMRRCAKAIRSILAASPVEQPAAAPVNSPCCVPSNPPPPSICRGFECKAGQRDGIICADGECDIDSGVRPAPSPADEQAAFLEVGFITQDEIHGWHFSPTVGWEFLGKGRALYARAASANETGAEGADALAHEVWSAAQLAPGEGIEDAVQRIAAILSRSPAMSTQPVRAWETDDGRVISDEQKQGAQAADPVAWRYLTPTGWHATTKLDKALGASAHHDMEPLYAAPQPAQADAQDVPADDLVGFVYVLENPDRPHDPVTRFSRRPLGVRSLGAKIVSLTPVYSRPAQADGVPECNGSHDAGQIAAGDKECTACGGE